MNDQIKLLVAGAAIAIVGVLAGAALMWCTLRAGSGEWRVESPELRAESGKAPQGVPPFALVPATNALRFSPPLILPAPSSPTNMANHPQLIVPPSSGSAPASAIRVSHPTMSKAMQEAMSRPEVQKAREEFAEAQKRYMETLNKAMKKGQGSGQP